MFVKIDNYKDIHEIDRLINGAKNTNNLSPQFAMEVLRMGNYYGNIKKLLHSIENLGESKWGEYKEFALSCVDGREVSPESLVILQNIAKASGCEDEFNNINANEKIYEAKSCKVCCRQGKYIQEDLSEFDVLHHEHDDDVCVWDAKLPKFADFSECAKGVDFTMTDCSVVKKFAFADNDDVIRFIHIGRPINNEKRGAFPKVLDLSQANRVTFDRCDFEGVDEIKFKQGSVVSFFYTSSHPKKLDFSMCEDLVGDFHASEVEELVFKDKNYAEVFMGHIHNFSGTITILEEQEKEVEEHKKDSNLPLWKRIFSSENEI